MKLLKIFLVDDHEMILDGLCALLNDEKNIEVVGIANNGNDVLKKLKKIPLPDVLILDINMPEKDGIEVTAEVKALYPEIKILILSMHNRSEFIKKIMETGADGYILKNTGRNELLTAIYDIASGHMHFGAEIMKTNFEEQLILPSHGLNDLSKREKEVIWHIAFGMTSQQIADNLNISIHTVDSHRKRILSKINAKNSVDIVRYALKTGIVKGFDIL